MFPILLSLGSFTIKTLVLFIVLAVMVAAFIFWKKGKEEHYNEYELMDCFIQSLLVGLLIGRVSYIIHSFPSIGFDIVAWLDIFSNPGVHGLTTIIATGFTLYKLAQKHKWDAFEVLDFWSIAAAYMLAIVFLGLFFDGTYYGSATELPIGIIFPGLFEKHHPLQLYMSGAFFLIALYLSRVEYRYRTFEWYRANKKTAQTGFLISVFTIFAAAALGISNFFRPTVTVIPFLNHIEYGLTFLAGVVLLWIRSGRGFGKK